MSSTIFVNGVTLTDEEWFQDVNDAVYDEVINVKNSAYGAVGDGVADDSAAVLAAVNAAAALTLGAYSSRAAVYFPPGIYKLGTSAALTETNTTSIRAGIHFFGAGMYTSILRLAPSGSDLYFYNNVATARTQFCSFSDLGFEGIAPASLSAYTDISNNAKGFRLWATTATGSHEQGFRFSRCRFFGLHTMFETAGDNTTSENTFFQCKIDQIKSVVVSLNNPQSFNTELHGCDVHNIYGDLFKIGASDGGAIKVFGGSVITFSDTGSNTWLVNCTLGSPGSNAQPIIFDGVRFELRGDKTNAVTVGQDGQIIVTFEKCLFLDQSTAEKAAWCNVYNTSCIYFRRCSWFESNGDYIRFKNLMPTVGQYGINGEIIFEECEIGIDWSDKCTVTSNFGSGLISARNCFGNNVGAVGFAASPNHWAHDFDLHWDETAGQYTTWSGTANTLEDSGSPSHPQWRLKTAQIKLVTEYWPDTQEHALKMPKNAIIKNIHLRKPAGGTDTTSVTFRIGRDDKSGTDHLVSNTAQFKLTHTGDQTNYFYHVGSTTNERTLRLYTAENPSQALQGGICIVEYY